MVWLEAASGVEAFASSSSEGRSLFKDAPSHSTTTGEQDLETISQCHWTPVDDVGVQWVA